MKYSTVISSEKKIFLKANILSFVFLKYNMLSGMLNRLLTPISTTPEGSSIKCIKYTVAFVFSAILAAIFAAYSDGLEKSTGTRIFFIAQCFKIKI